MWCDGVVWPISVDVGGSLVNTDQNLLFGVLALQLEYINANQFVDVCSAWTTRKNNTVADILVELGWISDEAKLEIGGLLERKLKKHDQDSRKALSAIADASVRDAMRDLNDEEVDNTVDHLAPPPGAVRVMETVDYSPEERSHYTLSRMHTQGGLGRLWVARDRRLHREVALKEIRPDRSISDLSLRRFVREAQITGQLEHPNIVPVYELIKGPDSDRPFYTMRFVRGQPLSTVIEEFHRMRREGKFDRLELRRLLNAFVSVCHAISYAHSKGVVHRDLKPANVMLGAFGEVVLLDWGLAKMVDRPDDIDEEYSLVSVGDETDGEGTQLGQMVGTLPYMSPEQAEGRPDMIDARTDIYGLGATFFRLLTGRQPHFGKSKDDIVTHIVHEPTPLPREVDPSIPKALDAICARAMAEKRADRYQSATEMADDVRRWLADEPVSVHREPWHERFARWTRKHRGLTIATAAALLIVATVSFIAALLINDARVVAEEAQEAETLAKEETLEWFRQSRDTVDSMLTGVSHVLVYYPGAQELRKRLQEEAAEYYEQLTVEETDDPQLLVESARCYVRLGDVHRLLIHVEDAQQAYRTADKILAEFGDTPDVRLDRTICLRKLGDVAVGKGEHDQAQKAFDQAKSLADQLPSPADRGFQLAHVLMSIALLANQIGDTERAEQLLQQAESELRGLLERKIGDEQKNRESLAMMQRLLGEMLVGAGRNQDAIGPLREAKKTYQELHSQDRDYPPHLEGLAITNINLANALRVLGRPDEECVVLEDAIDGFSALLHSMPDVPQFQRSRAGAQASLGRVLHLEHANEEARALLDRALEEFVWLVESSVVQDRDREKYKEELAIAGTIQAQILRDLGDRENAEMNFRSAIQLYVKMINEEPKSLEHQRGVAITGRHLGQLLHVAGRHDEAKQEYQTAIALFERVLEADRDEPDPYARDGLSACLEHLGDLFEELQQIDEASTCYEKALAQRHLLPDYPQYQFRLASLLLKCNDAEKAAEIGAKLTKEEPDNGDYWTILGAAQFRARQFGACVATLEGIESGLLGFSGPEREFWLAMAYHKRNELGDTEKAKAVFDEAVGRMDEHAPGCLDLLRLRTEAAELLGIDESPLPTEPETPDPKSSAEE